jgi:ubiquitin C-terminal hydrolase
MSLNQFSLYLKKVSLNKLMEGINNLGATCAINSLIQIICRSDNLRNVILNANVSNESFTGNLKEVLDLMYNQKKSLHPAKFINCFYNKFNGIFNRFEQIDINELWFYFYEKINEETCKDCFILDQISNIDEEHDYKINIHNNKKESELTKLVQGSYINIIICTNCNKANHSFEPFISIALDIDEEENLSIANLMMKHMKNEYREKDDWICDKCNEKHSYIKTRRIWKLPKVLFMSLNRFKDLNMKNNKEIFINDNIIFNAGSIVKFKNNMKYDLQGIGLHHGNLSGGHYTALCNMKNECFNIYNDNEIHNIKTNEILPLLKSNSAYLIVYEN